MGQRLEALSSKKITWALVLVLCLGIRLGAGFYKGDSEITDSDARVWMGIANNLNAGHGFSSGKEAWEKRYPTAYSEPGYPTFLALVYRTVGDGLLDIDIAQSVVDTVTCLVVMLLAVKATGGRRLTAVLAGLAYALYPPFILSTCTPMTETLSTLVITLALFATASALERETRFVLAAGAMMGLAILVRSPMTFFPIVVAIVFFLRRGVTPGWGRKSLAYVAAAYLVFAPWVIRNYVAMHAFVLVPTRGSMAFWGATGVADGYTLTNWRYPIDSKEFPRIQGPHDRIPDVSEKTYLKITSFQKRMDTMGEIERDRALKQAGIQQIREHPALFAFLGVKKVFRLWLNLWYDWPASTESKEIAVLNLFCLVLAALGYRRAPVGAAYKSIIAAALLYVTAVSVVTCAVVRYSYPVMPLVLLLAAAYVGWLLDRRAQKREREGPSETASGTT